MLKTTDFWESSEYFEDAATKLIMKRLEHVTQPCSPAETLLGAELACLAATTRSMPTESLSLINGGSKTKLLVPHHAQPGPLRASKLDVTLPFSRYGSTPPHTAPAKTHLRLS